MVAIDLKRAREKLELTQIEASKLIGVSVTAYRLWEHGGGNPGPENLKKLMEVLELDRDRVEGEK